ncbi:MAG: TolC family protein, partial [Bryocella sp.]
MRFRLFVSTAFALALSASLVAQTNTPVTTNNGTPPVATSPSSLPIAPGVGISPEPISPVTQTPAGTTRIAPLNQLPAALELAPQIPADAPSLTLAQAEQAALAHNPRVALSRLLALAQGQTVREQRAAELPILAGNITAVAADNGSRITAGGLNNPVLYQRAAAGLTLNQLLTDFGRTRNLVSSAELRTKAAESTLIATRADILFAVDQSFYQALGAQALIQVATQTVKTRQDTATQIQALVNARLRSTLDLNFASANLSQAQLLLLDARNQSVAAQANLSALLGDPTSVIYRLVDETPATPAPAPAETQPLIQLALNSRPDLVS